MIEPPYGIIRKALNEGSVVPFLGAGASMVGRPTDAHWDPQQSGFLPSGRELSRFLAQEASFPSQEDRDRDDLAKVASYYAISGRKRLSDQLHEVLGRTVTPGTLHYYLASIKKSLLIVSTNYDTLLEQAFQAAKKPYDLVVHPTERKDIANSVWHWRHGESVPTVVETNLLDVNPEKTTVIYKMHGTVHPETKTWDSFVITEEDYVDFLARMTANAAVPSIFYEHFRTRSFLFLGYGLGDWNLRVVLKNLHRYLRSKRAEDDEEEESLSSWAIQLHPSELERKLWEKRNISIFDMALDAFVARMQQ